MTDELPDFREAAARMRTFVDDGDWRSAPWAEGLFTEQFLRDVTRSSVFVDVGAEIGFYSYLAAKNMPPDGRLFVFEPDPGRYQALADMFQDQPRVRVIERAVSDANQELHFTRPANSKHPCPTAAAVEGQQFSVQAVRLDDFLHLDRLDVIKMDIEGAETDALLGMRDTIARCRPRLFVEVHPDLIQRVRPGGLADLEALLKSLDYVLFNCDYDELIPTRRALGGRLYACHREHAEGMPPMALSARRLWLGARVRVWLLFYATVRKALRGY
jgi:FkbM family methyltransferase